MERLASTIGALGAMFLTGVVVARVLGPDGKGVVATLSYIAAVVGTVATLGAPASLVIRTGRQRTGTATDRGVTAVFGVVAGTLAGCLTGLATAIAFSLELQEAAVSATAVGVAVAGIAIVQSLHGVAESSGRIRLVSISHLTVALGTASATGLLLLALRSEVSGAVVAQALGPLLGIAVLVAMLRDELEVPGLRACVRDVRAGIRLGLPIVSAEVTRLLARRVDVLLVYWLTDAAAAGLYSVAVTVGEIVTYAPGSLRHVAFPAIAGMTGEDPTALIARVTRSSAVIGLAVMAGLLPCLPWLVPLMFGPEFSPAVVPAAILVAGGVVTGAQSAFCYSLAARAEPGVLLTSFGTSLGLMVLLDLVLIPRWSITGAAAASVLASSVGLWAALRVATVRTGRAFGKDLLPRLADVRDLHALLLGLTGRAASHR